MRLPEFGVKFPVTNIMIFFAVLVIGLVSLGKLSIDLMPEIEPPVISVLTVYEGASAEDVEAKITEVIENNLAIVSNLDKLTSRSMEGLSMVVQTGNIVYKIDWVHSLHIILYGKEVTYHAVENNKCYGPKDSAYCRLAIKKP